MITIKSGNEMAEAGIRMAQTAKGLKDAGYFEEAKLLENASAQVQRAGNMIKTKLEKYASIAMTD